MSISGNWRFKNIEIFKNSNFYNSSSSAPVLQVIQEMDLYVATQMNVQRATTPVQPTANAKTSTDIMNVYATTDTQARV